MTRSSFIIHRSSFGGALAGALYLVTALTLAGTTAAQTFPAKPVRFIVPFPPGGSTDLVARILAQRLTETLAQPVIVDNRGGAGGIIGAELAVKAPADGYTILLGSPGPLSINPNLQRIPYDPLRDLAPIVLATVSPFTLVLHPATPASTVKELIALAKSKPGQLNYGSQGNGAVGHFSAEQFKALAGITAVHVPYKGAGPAVADLLSGRLHFMFENLPTILAHVRSGKLRMLAVGTKTRSALVPEYPTLHEAGVAGYESSTAFGVLAPAKTPAAIIARFNRDLGAVLGNPEIKGKLSGLGLEAVGGTPQQYAAHLKEELSRYGRIAKSAGIRLD